MKRLRCAIYTRKSSEEGLDQAFNSLHAQREACEAYVLSQAGEGWTALSTIYDDGGFSGGNMERPALKRLLADIKAGQIDVVVVYKVDRLTRALGDFARIVEQFDASGVSFVSVTQAFNTTSSMGRLTLNVLLSFAQFEREVTGERIRDKIAASKKKGMWMGGALPLGYDPPTDLVTRALVINPGEAETVRLIFRRYLELGSVHALALWLDAEGVRTKVTTSKRGTVRGGVAFNRGALFHLLQNPTYIGQIPHKDISYPGAHLAIIERDVFDAAQALLARRVSAHRRARTPGSGSSPLKGLLFDADGAAMSPAFSLGRGGVRYRYYVSTTLQQGRAARQDDDAVRRISAPALEAMLSERLTNLGAGGDLASAVTCGLLTRVEALADSVVLVLAASQVPRWGADPDSCFAGLQRRRRPDERLWLEPDSAFLRFAIDVRPQLCGGRTRLIAVDGAKSSGPVRRDRVLIRALRAAHMRVASLGQPGRDPLRTQYDRHLMRLAYLAPDIQRAILDGRQPADLTLGTLIRPDQALSWAEQRRALGM